MKNIVLVFGGKSVEHDISILTALTFSSNYVGDNRLCNLYISKSGEWFFCTKRLDKSMFIGELSSDFIPVKLFTNDKCLYTKTLLGYKRVFEIDAVINCCHGGEGERGELGYIFESSNIPMSSGTSLGLAISMDKSVAKTMFAANNIPTVSWLTFSNKEKIDDIISKVEDFGYPVIVKPNSLGSSIGVEKVENRAQLSQALFVAFEFDSKVIVEKIVPFTREFNCAVIAGEGKYECSMIDEPVNNKIFSFEDKYLSKKNDQKTKTKKEFKPADISEKLSQKIIALTKKCARVLDLHGVIRVDFLYDSKKGRLFVNEVNAVPGSLAYFLFKDMTQTKLIDRLARIAEKENEKRVKIKKEYITEVLK